MNLHQLPDGRCLGYDEHGAPEGKPVLYFHGTPSCRGDWGLLGNGALACRLNVRIIAPDRPGVGLSDFQPGRRLVDWPDDVAALANALGLDRFAVLGYSGGGPYAAVCAWKLPHRLTKVGIVGGMGPFNLGLVDGMAPSIRWLLSLACDTPWGARQVLRLCRSIARHAPGRWLQWATRALAPVPPVDMAVVTRPDIQRVFITTLFETMRNGPGGPQVDTALMLGPWGFALDEIETPVCLWYGEADRSVSPAMGRYLDGAIPNSQARFYPGEGHFSLAQNYLEEILTTLTI